MKWHKILQFSSLISSSFTFSIYKNVFRWEISCCRIKITSPSSPSFLSSPLPTSSLFETLCFTFSPIIFQKNVFRWEINRILKIYEFSKCIICYSWRDWCKIYIRFELEGGSLRLASIESCASVDRNVQTQWGRRRAIDAWTIKTCT